MGNRASLKQYDFTLSAGGSMQILVEADYFRIQSSTGAVNVTGDSFGTLPGLLTGQGLASTPYKRLVLQDASGSANSGTILCSGDLFIDNRTYGVTTISGAIDLSAATQAALNRPQAHTGFYNTNGALIAGTAETIIAPGSNPNGAILLNAFCTDTLPGVFAYGTFIAKASTPANINDGAIVAQAETVSTGGSNVTTQLMQTTPVFINPNLGLFYLNNQNTGGSSVSNRSCRYRLL